MKLITTATSSRFEKVLCLGLILSVFIASPVEAQDAGQVSAEVLVRQILDSVDKGDLKQADTLTMELSKGGDDAVAAIQDSLMAQAKVRTMLTFALGQIFSDASTEALLQNADFERDGAGQSLALLDSRSINRPLTQQELDNLISRVKNDDGWQAGMAARILSKSSLNDVESRAEPIVSRFITELSVQKPVTLQRDSEGSERVARLGQFLFSFSNFDNPKVIALLQQQSKKQTDASVLSWLNIALGFAGDDSVAVKLKGIVVQEKDVSTKAVALRAYGRAAKFAALPLLKTIIIDQIKIYGPSSRNLLLATAESEVFRLRSLPGFPTTLPADIPETPNP